MSGESFVPQPVTMFGGWVPNAAPEGLANGMSWDCQDVDLVAAGVRTRPGLVAQFPALTGSAYVNYLKTFPTLAGVHRLVVLDSLGNLYKENPPGTLELVVSSLAESAHCRSETHFGREYMAFSDGVVGVDMPRQFDDTNFDRVSQVGPGEGPTVASDLSTVGIEAINRVSSIVTVTTQTPHGLALSVAVATAVRASNVVTVTTESSHGLAVGSSVVISGVGYSGATSFNGTFVVTSVPSATTFTFAQTGENGSGAGGLATPSISVTISGDSYGGATGFNGTFNVATVPNVSQFTYFQTGEDGTGTGGSVTIGANGTISAGTHQVAVSFVTEQGYWTRPSPPVTWTASGDQKVYLNGIPTGPPNIVGRVLMFTAAGQSGALSFYTIAPPPGANTSPGSFLPASTMYISDNVATTAVIDFTDTDLLAGTSCAYLFDLVELPEQAGVIAYSDRLFWWGERNGLWSGKNGVWLNLTFDGGFAPTGFPLGWTPDATNGAGGSEEQNLVAWGSAYRITGDGAAPVRGKIKQSAVADYNGVSLISANTGYSVRARLMGVGLGSGTLHVNLASASYGFVTAGLAVPATQVPTRGYAEFVATLTDPLVSPEPGVLPAIPPDLVLQVYADGTPTDLGYFLIDNIEVFQTELGNLNGSILRASRVNDPESYDGVLGLVEVSPNDGQRITNAFVLRNNLYIVKERSFYVTADDGTNEPALWQIQQVSNRVGTPSIHGIAMGDQAAVIAGQEGIYVFDGSPPEKLSQEIQTDQRGLLTGKGPAWDQVNWAAGETIWTILQNDKKRLLVGVPVGAATTPNQVLALYFPYNTDSLADVTIFRKFKDAPLARGWAPWTIAANSAAMIVRPDGNIPVLFGSNDASGNIFALTEGTYSDNGKLIPAYYSTYFVNGSDLGLPSVGRKLFGYLRANVQGQGTLVVAGFPTASRAVAISAISRAGNVTSVTTATPHGLYPGQLVDVQGVSDASYDGQVPVLAVPGAKIFTYPNAGATGTPTGGTVVPLLGTVSLSSPASPSANLELPINVSSEMLAIRLAIDKTGNPGDWFYLSQRVEVYLKLDPWAPFGSN